jgi:hypothetical protein
MVIIHQPGLFSWEQVDAASDMDRLQRVPEALPDEALMLALEAERKGKRDDYPLRAVWNSMIAGVVFQHEGAQSLLRELTRNAELRQVCGFGPLPGIRAVPPPWVYTRLYCKLTAHQAEVDALADTTPNTDASSASPSTPTAAPSPPFHAIPPPGRGTTTAAPPSSASTAAWTSASGSSATSSAASRE